MLIFNGQAVTLKYLFNARFADGKTYQQNEQDNSVLDAERSCFFDVLQEVEKGNHVEQFQITDGTKDVTLDVPSGTFTINDVSFKLHDEGVPYHNKRLIFFRRRSQDMVSGEEISCKYAIGWQGNVAPEADSKCEQFKIFVD